MLKYSTIEITNVINKLRDKILTYFTDMQMQYDIYNYINDEDKEYSEEELKRYEDLFISYQNRIIDDFEQLKIRDSKMYKQVITLMYHDYCIIAHDKDNEYYEDEIETFNDIKQKINSFKDLVEYLNNYDEFYCDLAADFIDYTKTDYFNKRKLMLENEDLDDYLKRIYPLHIIDKLYYTLRYTKDNFIGYLDQFGEDGIGSIIETLKNLYHTDKDNYNTIMLELIEIYYKSTLYKLKNVSSNEDLTLLKKIENINIDCLADYIINNLDYLEEIILEFYRYSVQYNENYISDVDKLYETSDLPLKNKIKKRM